eukprot:scaffold2513_cov47-Attheya_sp.AAC.1
MTGAGAGTASSGAATSAFRRTAERVVEEPAGVNAAALDARMTRDRRERENMLACDKFEKL